MDRDRIKEIEGLIGKLEAPEPHWASGAVDLMEDAASALRQLLEERKWKTIESAPKDGTEILIRGTAYSMLVPDPITTVAKWDNGWWGNHHNAPDYTNVTHWMPLPAPPEEVK
jgi:hypothetical protein